MAQIVVDCPHCGAQSMTMKTFGLYLPDIHVVRALKLGFSCYAASICGACSGPVVARLIWNADGKKSWNDFTRVFDLFAKDPTGSQVSHGLRAQVIRTPSEKISVPPHLPKPIERAFFSAETSFRLPHMEEAAAAMYRRAIDLAVQTFAPGGKDDLMHRIGRLAQENILPGTMKDWAHQVRLIGNNGAHDMDGVERNDLIAAQGFTDALLRYLFTLPIEVQLRRAATETPSAPSEEEAEA